MSSYPYASLRYVDSVTTGAQPTFLFRGPRPLIQTGPNSWQFDATGLDAALRAASPTTLPPDYYLVDVNLLHANQGYEVSAEIAYFDANPNLGEVHWWQTTGTEQCYFALPPDMQKDMLQTFDQWLPEPLIWGTATLRYWLSIPPQPQFAPSPVPAVIYVHCDGGCDRTGEFMGAYWLRYKNPNWQDMYTNNQPCGNPPGCDNYRALQWYAFWLNSIGISVTGIGEDGGCNDPGGVHQPCPPPSGA